MMRMIAGRLASFALFLLVTSLFCQLLCKKNVKKSRRGHPKREMAARMQTIRARNPTGPMDTRCAPPDSRSRDPVPALL